MTILERIIADKQREVAYKKELIPQLQLQQSVLFEREGNSLAQNLKNNASGIIAEHKRRSPSKEVINQSLNCFEVVQAYEKAGVAAISVLTDGKYFGGSLDDLLVARANTTLPILRKDFVIDTYQITEAKAYGADAVLLIAAVLTPEQVKNFAAYAHSIGLETLLEVHNAEEVTSHLTSEVTIVGVNNRNLKTFEVSTDVSKELSMKIPSQYVKVSESGISDPKVVKELKGYGYQGFLIGENFIKSDDILTATTEFVTAITQKYKKPSSILRWNKKK